MRSAKTWRSRGSSSPHSSAAARRHGSPERWPDEHEPRAAGHWCPSQYAAYGRRCACLRRSRAVRQFAWSAHFGCRSPLPSASICVQAFSRPLDENADNPLPPACIPPCVKIALHRRIGWELQRQRPPLAASRNDVEDRFDHTTQLSLTRPAAPVRSRQQPPDQRPFRIGHIACITQFVPPILLTSDLSPGHRALPRIFANPMESHPTEVTHPFFSQALRMTG